MARDVQQDNIYERKSKARDKMKEQVPETCLFKTLRVNYSWDKSLRPSENNLTKNQAFIYFSKLRFALTKG